MSLGERVLETIRRKGLLEREDAVLVACSGGPDSVALLGVLKEVAAELGVTVRAAHVNHRLRGTEADADQEHVRRLCEALAVPLDCVSLELQSTREKGNLEDAARRARYDQLAGLAAPWRAVVATGHTLNDQAETFLMKLLRGAGPGGLSGIAVRRTHRVSKKDLRVTVIRPFLEVDRGEVLDYLKNRGLDYCIDRTNRDTQFDRNWVRHELLPVIEKRFNPRLIRVLGRTAGLFHELDDFLEQETARRLEPFLTGTTEVRLPIDVLRSLPDPLKKVAIRMAYRRFEGSLADLTLRHVESALELLDATSGRRINLPRGVVAQKEFGELRIGPPPEKLRFSYRLDWPGEQVIPEVGKKVVVQEREPARGGGLILPERRLIIRNRRPGDRYRVGPRSPEKSLKRILIERRIPVSRRNRLLVFECAGEIVWVEGLAPAPSQSSSRHKEICTIRIETFGTP